jgi:predicted transcriptional regulator
MKPLQLIDRMADEALSAKQASALIRLANESMTIPQMAESINSNQKEAANRIRMVIEKGYAVSKRQNGGHSKYEITSKGALTLARIFKP